MYNCDFFVCFRTYLFVRALLAKILKLRRYGKPVRIVVRNETSRIVIFCHAQMSRIVTFFVFVRNGPYPLPAGKNFESPRELQSSSNLDHRIRTAFLCRRSFRSFAKSARTKTLVPKQTENSQIYVYIHVLYQESVEAL